MFSKLLALIVAMLSGFAVHDGIKLLLTNGEPKMIAVYFGIATVCGLVAIMIAVYTSK